MCIPFLNSNKENTDYLYPWATHPIWEDGLGQKLPGTGSKSNLGAIWPLSAMCPLSEEVESDWSRFQRGVVWSSYGMNYHYNENSRMKYHGIRSIEVYELTKVITPAESMFMADGVWSSLDRDLSNYEFWIKFGNIVKHPFGRDTLPS